MNELTGRETDDCVTNIIHVRKAYYASTVVDKLIGILEVCFLKLKRHEPVEYPSIMSKIAPLFSFDTPIVTYMQIFVGVKIAP